MNPLLKRLALLRWKVRMLDGWQGITALLTLIVGVSVAVGVTDFLLQLPSLGRAAFFVGTILGAGGLAYNYLIKPFARPCDDLQLALRVEEAYPELNDALASTVQFLKQSREDQVRLGGSDAMREQTVNAALAKADQCDFGRILDRRGAAVFTIAAVVMALTAGALVFASPASAKTAMLRFVDAFGGHTWTTVSVERSRGKEINWEPLEPSAKEPDRIAQNQQYRIRVTLAGRIPPSAKVEIEGQLRADQIIGPDKMKNGTFELPIHLTQEYHQKFRYRVLANDGSFPPRSGTWHVVEVREKPKIDVPAIDVYPPAYTDLPSPKQEVPGTRSVTVIEGSKIVLFAKADRPITEAYLEIHLQKKQGEKDEAEEDAKPAAAAPLQKVTALFEADKSRFRFEFTPPFNASHVNLHVSDEIGLDADQRLDVNVERDPLPDIKLRQPSRSLTMVPDAAIKFRLRATDDRFALKSVFIEHQLCGQDGNPDKDKKPQRILLYDDQAARELLPYMHALRRLSPKAFNVDTFWHLNNQFKVKDKILIVVGAEDFYDLDNQRGYGKSEVIQLEIVSKAELNKDAFAKLTEIQKQVQKIAEDQKDARAVVEHTKKLEKITPKDREALILAEEKQRAIQDQIGKTSDQGLRKELKELQQSLKDNNQGDSRAAREAGKIKGALDHIAGNELPQIEPKLAEARNELSTADKNSPKAAKNLEQTAKLQTEVLKALGELNEKLGPDNALQKHRDKFGEFLEKQEEIAKALEKINQEKRENDKTKEQDPKQFEKALKERIASREMDQKQLAEDVAKAIQQLEKDKQEAQDNGDKDLAERLDAALKKAQPKPKDPNNPKENEKPLSQRMKNAADMLKDKSEAPEKAIDQDRQIAKDLDKVLGELEDRNRDNTKQDIKDRQEAEKQIDDLVKKNKQLQKEAQALQDIKDKEERLKKKEELIKKHEELRDQIAKLERQVARLQEQQAADELRKAAEDVENARQKLQQDQNPQQDQQQAQRDMRKAQQALEESEQQLAREALIKIADKLKGLKEREDAAVLRTEDFHSRLMERKRWSDGTIDTIEGHIETQKAIGEETDSLREKIAQAKVFNDIMEKAKKSMDIAVANMTERRADGLDRREDAFDDEQKKSEAEYQERTVKHQKHAAQRLGLLLDALKEEIAKPLPPPKDPDAADNGPKEDKPQPQRQAQDGIPFTTQLKLLKAEQIDLKTRTEEFDTKYPDAAKRPSDVVKRMTELEEQRKKAEENKDRDMLKTIDAELGQLRENRDLFEEQERLRNLFLELTREPEPMEAVEPQPKGDKK